MNKAQIIGNLGKDPEVRTMQNGDRVCSLAVATSESWRDKTTGERKDKTEWHRVSIFNPHTVETAQKYLRKGSKVYIEGQITTRKWQDRDGKDQYTTEIVISRFRGELELLDRPTETTQRQQAQAEAEPPVTEAPAVFSVEDEIPL